MRKFRAVTKLEAALCGLLFLFVFVTCYFVTGVLGSHHSQRSARRPAQTESVTVTNAAFPIHDEEPGLKTREIASRDSERKDAPGQDSNPVPETFPADAGDVSMPLALIDLPDGLLTTNEQLAAFDMLRQQFIESVAEFGQDPAAPEYRQRWQEAQEVADDEFAALFGLEAYNQQQNIAMSAAAQTAQP